VRARRWCGCRRQASVLLHPPSLHGMILRPPLAPDLQLQILSIPSRHPAPSILLAPQMPSCPMPDRHPTPCEPLAHPIPLRTSISSFVKTKSSVFAFQVSFSFLDKMGSGSTRFHGGKVSECRKGRVSCQANMGCCDIAKGEGEVDRCQC
jgi:hypothetical protein